MLIWSQFIWWELEWNKLLVYHQIEMHVRCHILFRKKIVLLVPLENSNHLKIWTEFQELCTKWNIGHKALWRWLLITLETGQIFNVIESFAPIILWKWKSIFWSYCQWFIPYGRFHKYLLMQKRRLPTNRLGLQGTEQG